MKALLRILVLVAALRAAIAVNNSTASSRHPSVPYWSKDCPLPSVMGIKDGVHSSVECCCSITDNGAIGDNSTLNTIAIQSTIGGCHERCYQQFSGHPVIVYVPKGMFRTGSLAMLSNTRLHIGRGGAIYGSDDPQDYPLGPMLPSGYNTGKSAMFRALISGYNLENVSVTGENYGYPPGSFAQFSTHPKKGAWNDTEMSVIDGVGWKWWCKARSMPIPQDYCQGFNPNNETLPTIWQRPKLIEFYNSTNIVLDRFTARNSPLWFIHPFFSKNIAMTNLTILAPREVGNTDGLDPNSSENIIMDTCYIDVGDDGVSIKSSNHSGIMVPTRNVTMRNLAIKSRNWCIGSGTFGGIYDLLFEDSTIGDLETATSPWAIKFKSHRYYPGPIENITVRNIAMGKLGPNPWMYPDRPGSAFIIELSYGHPPPKRRSGAPLFSNVTFENISVESAGQAGKIVGFPEDCLKGLSLRNITIKGGAAKWTCDYIDLDSLDVFDVTPPVTCTGGCVVKTDTSSKTNYDSYLRAYQGISNIPLVESNDILSSKE